jgi:hypothetical protein
MATQPTSASSARFPTEYGQKPEDLDQDLLPWSYVEERLVAAKNYWVSTISSSGRPHLRPVDGVWVDGTLCFGGSHETRWVKNLLRNPAMSLSLPSDEDAIILEGNAQQIDDPNHPLAALTTTASREKYPQYYTDGLDGPPPGPFWAFKPRLVYAWTLTGFPNKATRWTFDQ